MGQYRYSIDTVSILYGYSIDTVSILYRYCIDTVSIQYRYCIDTVSIQHRYSLQKSKDKVLRGSENRRTGASGVRKPKHRRALGSTWGRFGGSERRRSGGVGGNRCPIPYLPHSPRKPDLYPWASDPHD